MNELERAKIDKKIDGLKRGLSTSNDINLNIEYFEKDSAIFKAINMKLNNKKQNKKYPLKTEIDDMELIAKEPFNIFFIESPSFKTIKNALFSAMDGIRYTDQTKIGFIGNLKNLYENHKNNNEYNKLMTYLYQTSPELVTNEKIFDNFDFLLKQNEFKLMFIETLSKDKKAGAVILNNFENTLSNESKEYIHSLQDIFHNNNQSNKLNAIIQNFIQYDNFELISVMKNNYFNKEENIENVLKYMTETLINNPALVIKNFDLINKNLSNLINPEKLNDDLTYIYANVTQSIKNKIEEPQSSFKIYDLKFKDLFNFYSKIDKLIDLEKYPNIKENWGEILKQNALISNVSENQLSNINIVINLFPNKFDGDMAIKMINHTGYVYNDLIDDYKPTLQVPLLTIHNKYKISEDILNYAINIDHINAVVVGFDDLSNQQKEIISENNSFIKNLIFTLNDGLNFNDKLKEKIKLFINQMDIDFKIKLLDKNNSDGLSNALYVPISEKEFKEKLFKFYYENPLYIETLKVNKIGLGVNNVYNYIYNENGEMKNDINNEINNYHIHTNGDFLPQNGRQLISLINILNDVKPELIQIIFNKGLIDYIQNSEMKIYVNENIQNALIENSINNFKKINNPTDNIIKKAIEMDKNILEESLSSSSIYNFLLKNETYMLDKIEKDWEFGLKCMKVFKNIDADMDEIAYKTYESMKESNSATKENLIKFKETYGDLAHEIIKEIDEYTKIVKSQKLK